MNITADTNLLVRVTVRDNEAQAVRAKRALQEADRVVITLATWCEYAWVMRGVYGLADEGVAIAIESLRDGENIRTDEPAVSAGLWTLRARGDFADGAMAHEGRRLGGEVFVSFDRRAVKLLRAQGHQAELL